MARRPPNLTTTRKSAEESASAIIAREAAEKASNYLIRGDEQNPAIIDILAKRALDPAAKTKEIVMIASFFERLSEQRKMVAQTLGLIARPTQQSVVGSGGLHLHVHGQSDVDPEERVRRLLDHVNGRDHDKPKKVIDVKVTDVA